MIHIPLLWIKATLAFILVSSTSCQKKISNWKYQETKGSLSCYDSSRLKFIDKQQNNTLVNLELEMVKTSKQHFMFINSPKINLPSHPDHPNQTLVKIRYGNNPEINEILLLKLEGQQKLIVENPVKDSIIAHLRTHQKVTIQIGQHLLIINPDGLTNL